MGEGGSPCPPCSSALRREFVRAVTAWLPLVTFLGLREVEGQYR